MLKKCSKCKTEKEATSVNFSKHPGTRDKLDSWCKNCRSKYRSEIRRGNYKHLISNEELKHKLETTIFCEICGNKESLVVDHCHKTEKYRGLLCNHCNRGLGHFRDNPTILEKAIGYLKERG